jgi:hypothetical protein
LRALNPIRQGQTLTTLLTLEVAHLRHSRIYIPFYFCEGLIEAATIKVALIAVALVEAALVEAALIKAALVV